MNDIDKVITIDSEFDIETEVKTLFKSKKGNYFLTEDSARKDSLTHKKCEKHNHIFNLRGSCDICWKEHLDSRYEKLEKVKWNGSDPLYSESQDEYHFDYQSVMEAIEEFAEECEISCEEAVLKMQLKICESSDLSEVDDGYWEDVWYDGAELPKEIESKLEELNKAIRDHGKAFSWSPDDKAAIV